MRWKNRGLVGHFWVEINNPAFERDTAGVLAAAINHDEYMT